MAAASCFAVTARSSCSNENPAALHCLLLIMLLPAGGGTAMELALAYFAPWLLTVRPLLLRYQLSLACPTAVFSS